MLGTQRWQARAGAVQRVHRKVTGHRVEVHVAFNAFHPDRGNSAIEIAGRLARKGRLGFKCPPI
jgi:hypothetical protein